MTSPSRAACLEPRPRLAGAAHVGLGREVEVRRGGLRLGHAARDGLLQLRQLDDLDLALRRLGLLARAGRRPPRAAGAAGAGAAARRALAAARLDVGLDDAPARARARDPAEVEAAVACAMRRAIGDALTRPSPSSRSAGASRRLPPARRRARRCGSRSGAPPFPSSLRPRPRARPRLCLLLGLLARAVAGGLAGLADARDHLADRQRGALLGDDLDQRPGGVGLVDHVRLVGLDLDQLVADRDLVADSDFIQRRIVPSSIESESRGMTMFESPHSESLQRSRAPRSRRARRGGSPPARGAWSTASAHRRR